MTAELEVLHQRWNEAWLNKDVAAVQEMMAPEYVYIGPTGEVLNRDAILAIIRSPGYRLKQGTRTEVVVMPLAKDVVALVHRWQGEGSYEGASFKNDHRCTMVCARRGSRWRIVLEHCSPNGARGVEPGDAR